MRASHLPHLDRPGTEPWLSFGLADGVLAHRVAACGIALKLSGGQRDRMRAGRPRSQAMPSRRYRGGCLAGHFSESRPAPFGKLPFAREPGPRPPRRSGSFESETGFVSGKSGPRPHDGADHSRVKQRVLMRHVRCGAFRLLVETRRWPCGPRAGHCSDQGCFPLAPSRGKTGCGRRTDTVRRQETLRFLEPSRFPQGR